jgi:hypothetical protein
MLGRWGKAQFLISASEVPVINKTSILHGLSGRICEMAREQQVVARLNTPCWKGEKVQNV